jgi:radical SAM enzyme (rSAM/lipoprotein system)
MTQYPFKRRLAFHFFKKFRQNEARLHQLRYLFWECTLRCNLNCVHCGSDCTSSVNQSDMPLEDFLSTAQSIALRTDPRKITVVITGGEPLLRSDLETCGRRLRELGFRWGIVSNGMAYTPQRHASLLRAGMGALTISLDGLANWHNWLRNNNKMFDKAVAAIGLAAAVPRLNFDVVTCVHEGNIDDLWGLKELLISLNVKHWRLFTIASLGRAANQPELLPNTKMMRQLMDFIQDARAENRIHVQFSCEGFTGTYEGKVRDGFFFCRAGINIGSVLVDGSISACPNIDRSFAQGSIYSASFMDVWEHEFTAMRNRRWMKIGRCASCADFGYCQGSGFHLRNASGCLTICHNELLTKH